MGILENDCSITDTELTISHVAELLPSLGCDIKWVRKCTSLFTNLKIETQIHRNNHNRSAF